MDDGEGVICPTVTDSPTVTDPPAASSTPATRTESPTVTDSPTSSPTPAPTTDSPTASSTASSTPAPAPILTVSGVWVIAMQNASKLLENTGGLAAFKTALTKEIAQLLNMGLIKEGHIHVDLTQSSGGGRRLSSGLKASYTITVPKGAEANAVATQINAKSTDDLKTAVNAALVETVKTVPDMQGLTSSGVVIETQGSIDTTTTPTSASAAAYVSDPTVTPAGGREVSTAHVAVISSVSLLCALTSLLTSK